MPTECKQVLQMKIHQIFTRCSLVLHKFFGSTLHNSDNKKKVAVDMVEVRPGG